MIKAINHMSFTVSNIAISIPFYRDLLGLELIDIADRDSSFSEKVTGIKGAYLKIAYLKSTNAAVELIQYHRPHGKRIDTATNNIGSAHICFEVSDFITLIEMLKSNNVDFASDDLCIVPAGPNKGKGVVYLHDPDMNTIELISSKIL